jgi:hypothetical protein
MIRFFPSTIKDSGINYKGLLDAYETNIYRAYGMIDFFTSYSGPCLQVNTQEDTTISGTATDINFNSKGVIDESQLLSVADGGSLYIDRFYDLSGNGRTLPVRSVTGYQKRARIVNNGVIETFNGKPSPFYQLSNIAYDFANDMLPASTASTVIYVHDLVRTGLSIKMGAATNSASKFSFVSQQGSSSTLLFGSDLTGNILRANKTAFSGTNRGDIYNLISGKKIVAEYGFSVVSGRTLAWIFNNYGAGSSGNFLNGYQPNMLMWDSNLGTTNIDAIMDLLNSYYTVY